MILKKYYTCDIQIHEWCYEGSPPDFMRLKSKQRLLCSNRVVITKPQCKNYGIKKNIQVYRPYSFSRYTFICIHV